MHTDTTIISILIPFLNEEENLPLLYARIAALFEKRPEALELLFIDDGSQDGGLAWIKQKAAEDERIKYIQLSRNFGHQRAITAGMHHCSGDAAIIMDADLQDPPEVIPALIDTWREGYDVVHAVRSERRGETPLKKGLAHLFYVLMSHITEIEMTVDAGDFRLIDRRALNALNQLPEQHRFMRGLAAWIGFRQTSLTYVREARHAGITKYPFKKSVALALNAITSFSGTPLRLIFYLGHLLCILSLSIALYLFIVWTWVQASPPAHAGTTYLTLAIFFISGLQMFCMGILGQYVRRVFDEIKERPLYLIQETNLEDSSCT